MKVLIDGIDIYSDISINGCYHEMYAENRSDELVIKFNDTQNIWGNWKLDKASKFEIQEDDISTGEMYIHDVVLEGGFYSIHAKSTPLTCKEESSKSWENIYLLQIVAEIASRHGLKYVAYGVENRMYKYINQNREKDLPFLAKRCKLEGMAFLVYDKTLVLYDEKYLESQVPSVSIEIGGNARYEYRDKSSQLFGRAEVTNGLYTGKYTADALNKKEKHEVIDIQIGSDAEIMRYAKGVLRNENKNKQSGIFWNLSLLKQIAPGSVVELKNNQNNCWDGNVFITRVRHDYVKKQSKVFFRRNLEGY